MDGVVRCRAIVPRPRAGRLVPPSTGPRGRGASGVAGRPSTTPTARVELVLEGPRGVVDDMLRWAAVGPQNTRVSGIEVTDEVPVGLTRFDTA